MTIYIRPSKPQDAHAVAPLIIEAIGDIAKRLTWEKTPEQVIKMLKNLFVRTDNRHSYLYTYVAVRQKTEDVVGVLVLYSGKEGAILDEQLSQWLQTKGAPTSRIDKEAHTDEYYIDTIAVHPLARGNGIGTALLTFAEEVARNKHFTKLSLNVETAKDKAQKLYTRQGFVITEPWSIIDEPFYHMVKTLD